MSIRESYHTPTICYSSINQQILGRTLSATTLLAHPVCVPVCVCVSVAKGIEENFVKQITNRIF